MALRPGQGRLENLIQLSLDSLNPLLQTGNAVTYCVELCINRSKLRIYSVKASVKINAQIIYVLVHRLLVEPTGAKDANYERCQRNDDRDNQRIHCF
jgi:hypothetical protein